MAERPVKDYDKFVLRLPEGMREAIAERAKRNGRSMNSEIVQILEDAISAKYPAGLPPYEEWNSRKEPKIIITDEVHSSIVAAEISAQKLEDMLEKIITKTLGRIDVPQEKKKT